jgi:hypothetical protein
LSEEELRAQKIRDKINKIAVEIEKIEETANKKDAYIEKKLCEEFDPKINEIKLKLQNQKAIFDELISKIDGLMLQKKELVTVIKNLEQEYNTLIKTKERSLNQNLKAIAKEKKTKTKIIDRDIKSLERELKTEKKK